MSFDLDSDYQEIKGACLNPFRSGQCLSTEEGVDAYSVLIAVSIPFDQGNVFRHIYEVIYVWS